MKKGIQGSKTNSSILVLSIILALVVVFLGYNLLTVFQQTSQDQNNLQSVAEMRAQSYRLVGLSRESTAGKERAFGELQNVADQMEKTWNTLNTNLADEVSANQLGTLEATWRKAGESLASITERFAFVSSSVQEIFEATPALFSASQANNAILDESPVLQEQISQLSDTVASLPESRDLTYQTALYAGVLGVILLAVMGLLITAETRRRLRETATATLESSLIFSFSLTFS